jgi:hypothetical protein
MTSRTLASSCGSAENLKDSVRQGCSPHSRHTLATFTFDRPSSAASSRDDQCVTPSRVGGGSSVASTTATSSVVRGLPGLGRSSRPPMPSAACRRFHAITVGLDTPARRTISLVPSPSPASSSQVVLAVPPGVGRSAVLEEFQAVAEGDAGPVALVAAVDGDLPPGRATDSLPDYRRMAPGGIGWPWCMIGFVMTLPG